MNKVTMNGNPLSLEGNLPNIGDSIKDFTLKTVELSDKTAKDYENKVLVIVAVPSIDTPVCDLEIQKFNTEAGSLSDDIKIVGVSADLPFAQARWATERNIKNIEMLSDYMTMDFAKNYGILIKELRLTARAIFVYDKSGKLSYMELVSEIKNEPNYSKAIEAAKNAL